MWAVIWGFVLSIGPVVVSRVMIALGIATVSYTGINSLVNQYLSSISTSSGSMDNVVHSLINIAGFDQVITILSSASITRVGLFAVKQLRFT